MTSKSVTCNGRDYRWPVKPTVVICIDGSEPGYIEAAIATGRAPTFARFMKRYISWEPKNPRCMC